MKTYQRFHISMVRSTSEFLRTSVGSHYPRSADAIQAQHLAEFEAQRLKAETLSHQQQARKKLSLRLVLGGLVGWVGWLGIKWVGGGLVREMLI